MQTRAFTLIETLVAITILSIAIVAPMTLAWQSLSSAYYARDQVTAHHLAQEAVEAVRSIRDRNILRTLNGTPTDVFEGIPKNQDFTIDTRDSQIRLCSGGCAPINHNGELYGHETGVTWVPTRFTRSVRAEPIGDDLLRILSEVRWRTGAFQERSFTISSILYEWVAVE